MHTHYWDEGFSNILCFVLNLKCHIFLQAQTSFVSDVMSRIGTNTDAVSASVKADLVVEAIIENLEIKKQLFASLDVVAPQ